MPNEYHDQPGLEVAPEPELPHVVEGPTIVEKPNNNNATQYVYEQQPQAYQGTFHQSNGYPNDAYSPALYPPSGQPAMAAQNQPYWGGSQAVPHITEGFPPDNVPPSSETILGLKKKTFWLIFGPLITLLIIGLAVGLGVGLGTSHNGSHSIAANSSTTSAPSSTSSSTPAPTPIVCPKANGTIYQGAGDDPFLVLCNVDYNGNAAGSGTTDIGNKEESTVEDCVDTCSNNSMCVGAGWGNYNGSDICWMKGSLGSPQDAQNWFFVIRQKSK
ncbi:hypothetical protein F5Y06DRAFT_256014 [Hypoxylon sp. FL0890]|nr:hypothetical protein F5Y06DRAFT_256014 [Hypoxylon sp. FL0890]